MASQKGNSIRNSASKSTSNNGKFLTFNLGQGEYGIDILKIREII